MIKAMLLFVDLLLSGCALRDSLGIAFAFCIHASIRFSG